MVVTIFLDIFWLATALVNPGIALSVKDDLADCC